VTSITSLVGDHKNARRRTDRSSQLIKESLQKYGAARSIVIDEENRILAGNGTIEGAKAAGIKNVRVIETDGSEVIAVRRTGLSEDEKVGLALADNRTADLSEWDQEMLHQLSEEHDISDWFTQEDLDELLSVDKLDPAEGNTDPDDVPETPEDPTTKPGDLWILGNHRLLCGDSTNPQHVERLMDGKKADMVFTDPPYGMFLDTDWSGIQGSMKSMGAKAGTSGNKYKKVIGDHDDFTPELIHTIFASFSYCKEIFVWGADYFAELLPNKNDGSWLVWDKRKESQAEAIGAEFELCWSKSKHKRRMLRHDWFGFLSSSNPTEARNRVHPTQKPTSLCEDVMSQWGETGDIVADLYGGSGTTLIACEKTSRHCRMMELDPAYCDVIVKRWEDFTGNTAVCEPSAEHFQEEQEVA
jgi:DNA modification methylase